MPKIHVWAENGMWFWDDAENHGGFDACVPSGPFNIVTEATNDAADCFSIPVKDFDIVMGELPLHYPIAPSQ